MDQCSNSKYTSRTLCSSKNFATILFMLEHNTKVIISLKITIGKDSGKFQKALNVRLFNQSQSNRLVTK